MQYIWIEEVGPAQWNWLLFNTSIGMKTLESVVKLLKVAQNSRLPSATELLKDFRMGNNFRNYAKLLKYFIFTTW